MAPNSRNVGSGEALGIALNFALAAAASAQGPYGGRIDTTKIGVMGHGQGALGAGMIASDARIQAILSFNVAITATKPFLVMSGDRDILVESLAVLQERVNASTKAAFIFFHMVPAGNSAGFITLLTQPNRMTGFTSAWWKYLLDNDATARTWFVGASCMLCGRPSEFDYGQNGL